MIADPSWVDEQIRQVRLSQDGRATVAGTDASMRRKKKPRSRMPRFVMKLGGLRRRRRHPRLDEHARLPGRVLRSFGRSGSSASAGRGSTSSGTSTFCFRSTLRGHCNLAMLLSQHRDADILARVAHHMGFDCVRGSTYRGGAQAIWELLERSRQSASDDHARRPARSAAAIGAGADLSGVAAAVAAGGDGLWLRPAVAGE